MMTGPEHRSLLAHPAWALILAGIPLAVGFYHGGFFIDDAYITFRYAENIAAGRGFVYNDVPVLGTTAPFYCFLLAAARMVGIPIEAGALFIGVLSAAVTPVLLWRMGIISGRVTTGLVSGLCLCLFPHWWINSKTGMETSLAGALAAGAVYLDLKERPLSSGLVCSLLALTRPDAAGLAVLIFIFQALRDRRGALMFALGGAPLILLWIGFAQLVFDSPVPYSLAAKRLIHFSPWQWLLYKYFSFFFSLYHPAGMAVMSGLWFLGTAMIVRSWPRGRALALWPLLFILGLVSTRIGSFFWYKMPAMPIIFFLAVYAVDEIHQWLRRREAPDGRTHAGWLRWLIMVVPVAMILIQVIGVVPWFTSHKKRLGYVAKQNVLREMAAEILARESGRPGQGGPELSVLAGEVGILGYELMDAYVIDSAGINSPEVYEIRKRDWERIKSENPDEGWERQWWGSPAWPREIIERYAPDYIASNLNYLHLRTLAQDPEFRGEYELVRDWSDPDQHSFVLFARKGRR